MGFALVLSSQKFLYIYTNEIQSDLKSDWKTLTCIVDFELIAMNVPQNNPQQCYDDCFQAACSDRLYYLESSCHILDSKTSGHLDSAKSLLWQDLKARWMIQCDRHQVQWKQGNLREDQETKIVFFFSDVWVCATVSHDKSKQAKVMVAFKCQRTFPRNPIQKIKVFQFWNVSSLSE